MQPTIERPSEPPGDVATQEQRNQTAKYKPNPSSNSERDTTRIFTCRWIQRGESNCCTKKVRTSCVASAIIAPAKIRPRKCGRTVDPSLGTVLLP